MPGIRDEGVLAGLTEIAYAPLGPVPALHRHHVLAGPRPALPELIALAVRGEDADDRHAA